MLLAEKTTLLFTGDSVTDANRDRPVGEAGIPGVFNGLGTGYVSVIDTFLNVYYPELLVRVQNTGTSGNTSRDLLARWQTEVADLNPDYLVVCIGFNDVWRQFDSPAMRREQVLPEEYAANLRAMIAASAKNVREMIFLTPYYMEPQTGDPMRARMDEYRALCLQICAEAGLRCIDLQQVFDEYLQYRHSSFITWDRVHPGRIGSLLIARRFLKEIGFDRPLI